MSAPIAESVPQITDELRWLFLQNKKQEQKLVRAFQIFRASGIEPVLIKGWAAARNYPADKPRYFLDIDLAVSAADYPKACKIWRSDEGRRLNIDLHRELRHLESRSWVDIFSNTILIEVEGVEIRIPAPEDHLRILCTHWLSDGGANKERLWDIYYAIANRPQNFDWDRCLNGIGSARRQWVVYCIGLAHEYLELPIEDLEFCDEAKKIPQWIRRAIEREWQAGEPLVPLHVCLGDYGALLRQIRKRIPPNPIMSVINLEKEFGPRRRMIDQITSFCKRFNPSVRRVVPALFNKNASN